MSDRARELELRGKAWFLFEFPLGYLNDADLSNGAVPPPFCSCCWNRMAAASARSWIKFSSFLDDRILAHRLLPTPPSAAGFVTLLEPLLFGGDLSPREKHIPIAQSHRIPIAAPTGSSHASKWMDGWMSTVYVEQRRNVYVYTGEGYRLDWIRSLEIVERELALCWKRLMMKEERKGKESCSFIERWRGGGTGLGVKNVGIATFLYLQIGPYSFSFLHIWSQNLNLWWKFKVLLNVYDYFIFIYFLYNY